MDSKLLKPADIKRIAMHLYRHHPQRISCIALKPIKYNELIASLKLEGRNLNHLLAWLHGTAILDLIKKQEQMQGVLVDQFSLYKRVQSYLKTKDCPLPCIERPGAEADPAVAAASIVARYQFVQAHEALRNHYRIDFPLGASKAVIGSAVEFCTRYGFTRLNEVAKLHFVTTAKVRERLEQSEINLFA
jgi:ribonuclease HIII